MKQHIEFLSVQKKKKNKGNVNLQMSIFLLPGKTADSPCEMSVLQGGEEIKSRRIRVYSEGLRK
ncbi:hypothetical protein POPTR_004G089450v4 [Populus trichocarpa]|uniref:Uncharacterized protein n=1 Tax=Populus trichocarpa TaxID=3694 RepID=A0ACC0T3R5_POPTR|nr:hypothetical protein POPTR_004G089450v4 [Populus trichocarpa]